MDPLNTEQVKQIVAASGEAAAAAAIRKFVNEHPNFGPPPPLPPKVEIPPMLKLAGGIITALMTAGIIALSLWVVSTLNELQLTVREISTQLRTDTTVKRLDAVEEANAQQSDRITALEQGKVRK